MSAFHPRHSLFRTPFSRRDLLRLTAAGAGSVSASGWLPVLANQAAQAADAGVRHKSCILLYMSGGPSHIDTFDLKHDSETGTEFSPIATSVPGIQISEHLPKLARLMHHGAIIRSMSTAEADHDRGRYLMHTGYSRSNGGVPYPSMGALVSSELGEPGFLLPNFVVCNLKDRLDPAFTGYLGPENRGMILENLDKGIEDVQPVVNPNELADRLSLLYQLDDAFRGKYRASSTVTHQSNYHRSLDLMRADKLKAFNLALEPASAHSRYTPSAYDARDNNSYNGLKDFGKGCLLARRLVEVGVPFVEVVLQSWDTHQDNFPRTKLNCEALDPAMSALIEDLQERGLLDSTLVIWMGEFGRTPKFEYSVKTAGPGRGHFGRAWSTVLMGGGIQGGQVIGRTDKIGGTVEDRPVSAADFMATICEILGIDWQKINTGPGGRTVRLTDKGATPIKGLLNV